MDEHRIKELEQRVAELEMRFTELKGELSSLASFSSRRHEQTSKAIDRMEAKGLEVPTK